MPATIRPLAPADAPLYVTLRREMLADTPHAFSASPEDDKGLDPVGFAATLATPNYAVLGAFADTPNPRLLGVAGLNREPKLKRAHIAWIWGVYVTPSARRHGLARRLLTAAIDHARTWQGVHKLTLSVSSETPAARRLYESLGFKPWGTEPDALRTGGRSFDEVYLSLALKR